ncbi:MAG TPA: DUF4126 domain-containing protein [Candidatus Eisenbacteria bacterium]|nr:DUF4126 domain-containing protein [Candidatus Eisenbacteria bacterium]
MSLSFWLALAAGVGISAACGLRAFLPLLCLGIAGRFAGLPLEHHVQWLTSNVALIALGAATVIELVGDKIPVVDHALDVMGTVIRPAAGWLGAYALLVHWPAPWGAIVALILGGGALALHALRAKLRLGSTFLTAGAANPFISLGEDIMTIVLAGLAILAPLIVLILVLLWVAALVRWRRRTAPRTA